MRICLNEVDFIELVAGREVCDEDFSMILSDIGFDRMRSAIDLAQYGATLPTIEYDRLTSGDISDEPV